MIAGPIGEIGLEFLPNSGGEAEGLGDAGIETFRDKPFAAVARETGQNSRDALDTPGLPVRITFDQISVPTSEFPSIGEFLDAARRCLAKAEKRQNEKDIGFFRQAVMALSAQDIQVMRVADFNTKGVRGPCEEGSPFSHSCEGGWDECQGGQELRWLVRNWQKRSLSAVGYSNGFLLYALQR